MWVKLSSEYLNLDQVFRIRVTRGFRNGAEETVAEVETIDPKGQVGTITRYRGADAQRLQALLEQRCHSADAPAESVPTQAMTATVPDLQLP